MLVVGVFAVLFPRLTTGRFNSLEFEFASGALVFGLTFMASDPATLPDKKRRTDCIWLSDRRFDGDSAALWCV